MIGSVWNRDRGTYCYYRLARRPGKPWTQQGALGTGVMDALPALPVGSEKIGEGPVVRGTLLRSEGRALGEIRLPSAGKLLVGAGLLVLGYHLGRRWR